MFELVSLLLPAAYFIVCEASTLQATPGKIACRMRVTDLYGNRITLLRAAGRYFGKYLSALILGFGFLMVMWTQRKQGLHDILAGTCVIRREARAVAPHRRNGAEITEKTRINATLAPLAIFYYSATRVFRGSVTVGP